MYFKVRLFCGNEVIKWSFRTETRRNNFKTGNNIKKILKSPELLKQMVCPDVTSLKYLYRRPLSI